MSKNEAALPGMHSLSSRLEILENLFNNLHENFSHVQSTTRQINNENDHHCSAITVLERSFKELEERLYQVEQWKKTAKILCDQSKKPHKCPVCNGIGTVLTKAAKVDFDGMLRAGLETIKRCDACEGKGILWG